MTSESLSQHPTLSERDQILLDEYISTLTVDPHNTPRLFAIGFLGLPGSGKSTAANALSEKLCLPLTRSDNLRRFLNRKGFPGYSPKQEVFATFAESCTQFTYENKTSVIIDANFTEYAAVSRQNAIRAGAELLLIRVVCPEEVMLQRLEARSHGADDNGSRARKEHFDEIKARYAKCAPVEDVYFEIDSTRDLEPQLIQLHAQLCRDGYIAA